MSINEILQQKNITRYRLWKESGVPQATLSDICSGKTRIEKCTAETIFRIAKVPDVLTGYFNNLMQNGSQLGVWYCGHYHVDQWLIH